MTARCRPLWLAVAVAAVAVLTGCVSIPTQGPVEPGRTLADAQRPPRVQFYAFGPSQGDSPAGIVRGFLRAAADFSADHSVARSFLTLDKRSTWRPVSPVVVYAGSAGTVDAVQAPVSMSPSSSPSSSPSVSPSGSPSGSPTSAPLPGATTAVTIRVPVVARVLDGGVYQTSDPGDVEVITFHLAVVEGQWRISDPADGVLISRSDFSATFGDVPLYFPESTRRWLVPDVRWFPLTSSPTVVVDALLDGPSDWLDGAVSTGAPAGTALTANGVRNTDGAVSIDLSRRALDASPTQRQVLFAQLKATLAQSARVFEFAIGELTVTVEQARFEIPLTTAATPRPADEIGLDARPVVLDSDDRLARLDGLRSTPVPDLPALPAGASRPAVNADGTAFAALLADRSVLITMSAQQPLRARLRDAALTAPSFDPHGWVWTSPVASSGVVYALQGTKRVSLQARWLSGFEVHSIRLSREGARALLVASRSGRSYAFVAAVVRDEAGTPKRFVDPPLRLVPDLTAARDGAWLDARRVALLGRRPDAPEQRVWLVQIGGETTAGVAAPGILSITMGNSQYQLWVQTAGGAAYGEGSDFPALPGVRWPAVPG